MKQISHQATLMQRIIALAFIALAAAFYAVARHLI